jgi:hypothetical protein
MARDEGKLVRAGLKLAREGNRLKRMKDFRLQETEISGLECGGKKYFEVSGEVVNDKDRISFCGFRCAGTEECCAAKGDAIAR